MNDIDIADIQNTSKEEAKEQIINYFKKHKIAWVSELAENLMLDLDLVIDIVNELEKEGKLKETPTVV